MAPDKTSLLSPGGKFEVRFPSFTARITIRSDQELTVEVAAGDNAGFADTVEFAAVAIRDDVVLLSWQEHIGSTIVHVIDLATGQTHSVIAPAKGGLMRLTGRIKFISGTSNPLGR